MSLGDKSCVKTPICSAESCFKKSCTVNTQPENLNTSIVRIQPRNVSNGNNKTLSTENKITKNSQTTKQITAIKDKILYYVKKLFEKIKPRKKLTKSVNVTAKYDFSKIAIILRNSSEDLLTKYRIKLKSLGKEAVEFTLSKNKSSNEQLFSRLKKQGIKLVTICSDEVVKKSERSLLRFNIKWQKYSNENNLIYIHSDILLDENIIDAGVITKYAPDEEELRDIALGVYTLKSLSNSKSGQSIIVQSGKILGIETEAETTSDLIDRCIDLKGTKKGGILFKITKPSQHDTLDFPVIDVDIINYVNDAKLSGIAVNAKYCRIEKMQKVIKLANRKKIFIIGI